MNDETVRAEVLDRCLERIRLGEAPDRVLAEHPDVADEVRSLLSVARDLHSLPDPVPSVECLMRSIARSAAAEDPTPRARKPRFSSARVWVRAAAVLLIILVGGWGAVSASAQAVPGDILYAVKRLTERAQFFLTLNGEGKAELRIEFSARRLREAVAQLERGAGIDEDLLHEMLDEARRALDGLESLPAPSRNLLALRAAHLSEYQRETLDRLQENASPSQRKLLVAYRDRCGRRERWVREIIGKQVLSPDAEWTPTRIRRWREGRPDCDDRCR